MLRTIHQIYSMHQVCKSEFVVLSYQEKPFRPETPGQLAAGSMYVVAGVISEIIVGFDLPQDSERFLEIGYVSLGREEQITHYDEGAGLCLR